MLIGLPSWLEVGCGYAHTHFGPEYKYKLPAGDILRQKRKITHPHCCSIYMATNGSSQNPRSDCQMRCQANRGIGELSMWIRYTGPGSQPIFPIHLPMIQGRLGRCMSGCHVDWRLDWLHAPSCCRHWKHRQQSCWWLRQWGSIFGIIQEVVIFNKVAEVKWNVSEVRVRGLQWQLLVGFTKKAIWLQVDSIYLSNTSKIFANKQKLIANLVQRVIGLIWSGKTGCWHGLVTRLHINTTVVGRGWCSDKVAQTCAMIITVIRGCCLALIAIHSAAIRILSTKLRFFFHHPFTNQLCQNLERFHITHINLHYHVCLLHLGWVLHLDLNLLEHDPTGIIHRFICNLCKGWLMANVRNHVCTPLHQELKNLSFDKRQFDGGSEEDEDFLTYPMVKSPFSDCVSDIDLRELAEVVELFKVENLDRSDDSSEDLVAKLLWEEIEETKSVKNAERISIDDVPDKEKANEDQFKWHPYGSQERGIREKSALQIDLAFMRKCVHWWTSFIYIYPIGPLCSKTRQVFVKHSTYS
ncbi:hypothetical protein VP01_1377g2 [Puccinia sorghi]|uniref:Uncharacterized protein n=1 Tax=Puccinia sorghi TaxID=27349 RepID=A0A0L6VM21_9BASI|nr:hypothetical protein VP01_1377g2 [Puccinia sorghi]